MTLKVIYTNINLEGEHMAQLHINIPDDIKKQAQNELKKRGLNMTTEIKMVLYRLARLNRLSQKITSVPKETKPLSVKAKHDVDDNSTVTKKNRVKA